MSDPEADEKSRGFSEGLSSSQGDIRVLFVLNALLSTLFGWTIIWGLSLLGMAEYSLINVATAAIVLFALTYAVTMS
ncbi:hypothetical protein [Natronosalvus vescus]|uniref:hypothetical protein n=1 Tax=Natronosalvus vescus TaxID=2953881 RepID=UPI0020919E3A|nr:hypothetical protein [Natronosalvus vescus]